MQRQQGAAAAAAARSAGNNNVSSCQTQLVQPVHDMLFQTAINTSKAQQNKPLTAPVRLYDMIQNVSPNRGQKLPGKFTFQLLSWAKQWCQTTWCCWPQGASEPVRMAVCCYCPNFRISYIHHGKTLFCLFWSANVELHHCNVISCCQFYNMCDRDGKIEIFSQFNYIIDWLLANI